jgi:cytochrome c556
MKNQRFIPITRPGSLNLMIIINRATPVFAFAGILFFAAPAVCHGPAGPKEEGPTESSEMMKAQHERMAIFKEAAGMLSDAIIHNSPKLAQEGAEKLDRSLEGRERDVPHKNRSQIKEFHRLYDELEKRTEKLKAAIKADDLPRSAVAYGRILEVCATCHRKFRD